MLFAAGSDVPLDCVCDVDVAFPTWLCARCAAEAALAERAADTVWPGGLARSVCGCVVAIAFTA